MEAWNLQFTVLMSIHQRRELWFSKPVGGHIRRVLWCQGQGVKARALVFATWCLTCRENWYEQDDFLGWHQPACPGEQRMGNLTDEFQYPFSWFIHTADGQIFAVRWAYKKVASGAGIGLQILNIAAAAATGYYRSSTSSVQMNVYNMVVFQFKSDYSLEKIHLLKRTKARYFFRPDPPILSSSYCRTMWNRGWIRLPLQPAFSGKETFAVVYLDAVKLSAKTNWAPSFTRLKKCSRSIKLILTESQRNLLLPAPSQVTFWIAEYFRKEKKIWHASRKN